VFHEETRLQIGKVAALTLELPARESYGYLISDAFYSTVAVVAASLQRSEVLWKLLEAE
jgi:hypothetical protein